MKVIFITIGFFYFIPYVGTMYAFLDGMEFSADKTSNTGRLSRSC